MASRERSHSLRGRIILSESSDVPEISSLRELTSVQWKTGTAAVLGWLFDGLYMHLYTLVAIPFVAELLGVGLSDASVGRYSSIIQASFLVGWALGGAFFGVIAERIGRSRALVLNHQTNRHPSHLSSR